jgi:chromate transporter
MRSLPDDVVQNSPADARRYYPGEVFRAYLKLGLTSFGGPLAHLGYFRDELVLRRKWIDEAGFADLVALCQFLPGPASSQVGYALGLLRGGPLGALAAWCAFTLPSAAFLVLFAMGAGAFNGPIGAGLIHGLKIAAVAVVAQAVWGMARALTPDRQRAGIALIAVLIEVFAPGSAGQIMAILVGGIAGLWLCREATAATVGHLEFPVSRRAGLLALALFFLLLLGLPFAASPTSWQGLGLFDVFYRSGALVFGGGHVVLPLLEAGVVQPGWISPDRFLAGYGAAQAVPGPLFTFAAYLGAAVTPWPNGAAGAAIGLAGIFLPGLLLVTGTLPFWDIFRTRPLAQAAMRGMNAAVVGILATALYNPVWTSAILNPRDFAAALVGFVLLTMWKVPPWIVVTLLAAIGIGLEFLNPQI